MVVDLPAPFGPSRPKMMPPRDGDAEPVQGADALPVPADGVRLDEALRLDGIARRGGLLRGRRVAAGLPAAVVAAAGHGR